MLDDRPAERLAGPRVLEGVVGRTLRDPEGLRGDARTRVVDGTSVGAASSRALKRARCMAADFCSGVISPYSAQVAALRDRLEAEVAAGLEIDTADGFQGREREAIVVSLTRSNADGEIGFLVDHRRTNVAMTRARRSLIVVGDGATIGGDEFYAALLAHAENAGALRSAYELL